ncbi:MAG: 30S ribosomal protein S17, partial [Candidatus Paceibacterota bacterium]
MSKKQLTGKVVSDKMQKTIVVNVETIKVHPKYKKRYKSHKKYKAHNKDMDLKVGDSVVIRECAPISKHKKWE